MVSTLEQELAAVKKPSSDDASISTQPAPSKPTYESSAPKPAAPAPTFKVNDEVMAKWVSGDKAFYPAKITSVTGSSANPIFTVTFKGYGNTDRLGAADLKQFTHPDTKKRKADESTSSPAPGVIRSGPNLNANALELENTGDDNTKEKPKKKLKSKGQLEKGRNAWQSFSKGKMSGLYKKDSMFRTGEGVNAKGTSILTVNHFLVY